MSEPQGPTPAANQRLFEVDEAKWGDIYEELLDYARFKMGSSFTKGGGALPLGHKPEDIAQEAIRRVLEGKRRWDPNQDPDLCDYLKSVVSSLISALWEKADYSRKDGDPVEEHLDISSSENPTYNDCLDALKEILDEATSDDVDLEYVRMGFEDEMKSAQIASFIGSEVKEVYTLTRKLRRRASRKMKEHPCINHWIQLGFSYGQ